MQVDVHAPLCFSHAICRGLVASVAIAFYDIDAQEQTPLAPGVMAELDHEIDDDDDELDELDDDDEFDDGSISRRCPACGLLKFPHEFHERD